MATIKDQLNALKSEYDAKIRRAGEPGFKPPKTRRRR